MKFSYVTLFRYLGWIAAIFIMTLIFLSSNQNAEASSATSGGFIRSFLSVFNPNFNNFDQVQQTEMIKQFQHFFRKAAHFTSYFGLGLFLSVAIHTYEIKRVYKFALPILISLFYAITDEIHQIFVSGRAGRISDVLIDFSGAFLSAALISAIVLFYKKLKKRWTFNEKKRVNEPT